MNILHILETAWRGTLEEQDDTVVWTVHAMRNSGQAGSVLLRGNIVGHAVEARTPALTIGDQTQTNPVDLTRDLRDLVAAGVPVYVVQEDADDRGISTLIDAVKPISRTQVAALCDAHDLVWHW